MFPLLQETVDMSVCVSVSVKWLAVKTASEMTYIVGWGVKLYSLTNCLCVIVRLVTWFTRSEFFFTLVCLPNNVDFRSLFSFKRTISSVNFDEILDSLSPVSDIRLFSSTVFILF